MANRKENGSDAPGVAFRILVFYAISLLLSLVIIIIATTVLVVLVSLGNEITTTFHVVFILVIATNVTVAGASLRGILRTYPRFSRLMGGTPLNSTKVSIKIRGEDTRTTTGFRFSSENFSDLEIDIVKLLMEHGNSMLQNSIVTITGSSKATVSRAVSSLEAKGVAVRVRRGVTNEVTLAEGVSDMFHETGFR